MKKITPIFFLLFLALCLSDCGEGGFCCVPPPEVEHLFVSVKDAGNNDLLDPTTGYGFKWEDIRVVRWRDDIQDDVSEVVGWEVFDYSQDKGIYELMMDVFPPGTIIISWNKTESDTLKIENRQHYSGTESYELYLNGKLQENYKYVEMIK
ncbi:MAG: hypothetical protein LBB84_07275 [Tannerellaceae bacterium]|jgi:hypothetical protein|nr:hypothetical protein [Tannerellaceae bacterium]